MSRNFEIMLEYEAVPGKRPTRAEYEAKLGSSISSKDRCPWFAPISNGARALYKDFACFMHGGTAFSTHVDYVPLDLSP